MSETPGHGDDQHDDFDPEPAQALAPDEPRTASWMPLFGACVFLFGTVVFLVRFTGGPKDASGSASAVAAATAQKPAPAASQPRKTPPQDASGRAKMIENMKNQRAKASAAASGAAPSASAAAPMASASASAPPKPRKPPRPAAPPLSTP